MKLQLCLLSVGFLFAASANAQVYKCTFVEKASSQTKVIYSDSPCAKAAKQTLTNISAKPQSHSQLLQTTKLEQPKDLVAQSKDLDAAVARAVLDLDFKLAKSLAVTKEHWRLIALAEGESAPPQPQIIAVNNQPEISRAEECAQAKDSFESVSRISWRDRDLVAAKKSLMYSACGVSEPVNNQPIFVGQAFGGLRSGRWLYPNQNLNQHLPHHAGHRDYHQAVQPHFGYNHMRNNQLQSDFSLSYRSRHFGVSANSFNSSSFNTGTFNAR
jgi:hypothetical protein